MTNQSLLTDEHLQRIGHRSWQAALISGIGLLTVLGAVSFSLIKLGTVNEKIAMTKQELEATNKELATKRKELAALDNQIQVLRNESTDLRDAVGRRDPDALVAALKPHAGVAQLTPEEATSYEAGYRKYWLSLDVPLARRQEIKQVSYVMNHPSFERSPKLQGDPNDGFKAVYFGWGSLSTVIVEIELTNGKTLSLDFNQTAALAAASSSKPR